MDRCSLRVGPGEIFGLAGESGSGKSTVARMILGFEEPTSGTIIHRGKAGQVLTGKQIWRQAGVQAVFQNPFETFNPLRQVETLFLRGRALLWAGRQPGGRPGAHRPGAADWWA